MKKLNKYTKVFLSIGILLIIYGYTCRLIELSFFWESKSIGLFFVLLGFISLFIDRIKTKTRLNKKSIFEKIGIGIIIFVLFVQTILIFTIPFTDAYEVSINYLKNDKSLTLEIGEIKGFGLIPTGGIQKTTDAKGVYGSATINLTVKGTKKYKDLTIFVVKYIDETDWIVEKIE